MLRSSGKHLHPQCRWPSRSSSPWPGFREIVTTWRFNLMSNREIQIHRGTKTRIELHSNLVHLRPLTVADVSPAYLEWLCDPEVNRHLEVRFSIPSFYQL